MATFGRRVPPGRRIRDASFRQSFIIRVGRQIHDRNTESLPNQCGGFRPGHFTRQNNVHQYKFGTKRFRLFERGLARLDYGAHLVVERLQNGLQVQRHN